MSGVKSALLVGVGGQGAILISKIMANGFMQAGFDVKQSEVHGMAQRGGSVSTQVRWGDKVYGPVFGKGGADILVAPEKMEAIRHQVHHHCLRGGDLPGGLRGGHGKGVPHHCRAGQRHGAGAGQPQVHERGALRGYV